MSTLVFPMNLPSLDPQITRSEEYSTKIHTGGWWSLKEERTRGIAVPKYRYTVAFNGLRPATKAPAPYDALPSGSQAGAYWRETEIVLRFLRDHYGAWDTFLLVDPLPALGAGAYSPGNGLSYAQILQPSGTYITRTVRLANDSLVLDRVNASWWALKKLELVTVGNAISLAISPFPAASVARNATLQFAWTLLDAAQRGDVYWEVMPGGAGGQIEQTGLFTAPGSTGTTVIRCSTLDDVRVYRETTVTIT